MTSRNVLLSVAATALLVLPGCSPRDPAATVEVIDISLSITPRAKAAALNAVRSQIGHMERGDLLVVIPITGDAANDLSGHILRLSAPTRRESYDTDLRRFREHAMEQLAAWEASSDLHRSHTDILSTLDAASQELARVPRSMKSNLIIVSDFLEDDGVNRFAAMRALASPASAQELAKRLRGDHDLSFRNVSLCLGRLESTDIEGLPSERRRAVDAFWLEYFSGAGQSPVIQFDGSEIIAGIERACPSGKS